MDYIKLGNNVVDRLLHVTHQGQHWIEDGV